MYNVSLGVRILVFSLVYAYIILPKSLDVMQVSNQNADRGLLLHSK